MTSCILSVLLIPVQLSCLRASCRVTNSIVIRILAENWQRTPAELNTRTENWTGFIWNSLYNLRTDHTENSAYIVACLSHHCVQTVATLRFASRRIHWCFVTQQRQADTCTSIVACVITCLLTRCLAMLWPSTLQCETSTTVSSFINHNVFIASLHFFFFSPYIN
jgi:hypothetical protein